MSCQFQALIANDELQKIISIELLDAELKKMGKKLLDDELQKIISIELLDRKWWTLNYYLEELWLLILMF